jgi:hypothetical protein
MLWTWLFRDEAFFRLAFALKLCAIAKDRQPRNGSYWADNCPLVYGQKLTLYNHSGFLHLPTMQRQNIPCYRQGLR